MVRFRDALRHRPNDNAAPRVQFMIREGGSLVIVYDLISNNSNVQHIPCPVALERASPSERRETNNGQLYVL